LSTVRESDGLALSSAMSYLTMDQRAAAPVLHRALDAARDIWVGGERDGEHLRGAMLRVLESEPLAIRIRECSRPRTLEELGLAKRGALLSMAVRIGKARLIDNLLLEEG